ncbi:MAG: hypothetical protein H6561_03435 [Lewinellaceae bacterium]|nr:hypothetical protein [Lewinellaceae bacterium]HPR01495.1 hypothetical protein [Saprospiraceae bacterium]
MSNGWFNIPWFLYGIGCMVVAVIYMLVPVSPYQGFNWSIRSWSNLILRWLHPIVWIILLSACTWLQITGDAGMANAKKIALGGLGCYIIYLAVFIWQKGKGNS